MCRNGKAWRLRGDRHSSSALRTLVISSRSRPPLAHGVGAAKPERRAGVARRRPTLRGSVTLPRVEVAPFEPRAGPLRLRREPGKLREADCKSARAFAAPEARSASAPRTRSLDDATMDHR